jgi:hypothetical protein
MEFYQANYIVDGLADPIRNHKGLLSKNDNQRIPNRDSYERRRVPNRTAIQYPGTFLTLLFC